MENKIMIKNIYKLDLFLQEKFVVFALFIKSLKFLFKKIIKKNQR